MPKILFCGDLHGDLERARRVADRARDEKCDEVIQVGDWGYLWPGHDQLSDLDTTDRSMPMRFIDGNHDWHPELARLSEVEHNWELDGSIALGDRLIYQPRGTIKEYRDGTKIVFMGGAPSIDKMIRSEGASWWPEEDITEEDVRRALFH